MKTLLVLPFLFLLACSPKLTEPRYSAALAADGIVGGASVSERFSKHIVLIYNSRTGYTCSGTLLSRHVALTAAHCFRGSSEGTVVGFGTDMKDRSPGSILTREIAEVVTHLFYAPQSGKDRNDIALVYFKDAAPSQYQPVSLDQGEAIRAPTKRLHFAGYGRTGLEKRDEGKLRMVSKLVKNSTIEKEDIDFLLDNTDGKGTCIGDSGGPVFAEQDGQLIQIGVTSLGLGGIDPVSMKYRDSCHNRVVYTNVSYFIPWIQETMASFPNRGL